MKNQIFKPIVVADPEENERILQDGFEIVLNTLPYGKQNAIGIREVIKRSNQESAVVFYELELMTDKGIALQKGTAFYRPTNPEEVAERLAQIHYR